MCLSQKSRYRDLERRSRLRNVVIFDYSIISIGRCGRWQNDPLARVGDQRVHQEPLSLAVEVDPSDRTLSQRQPFVPIATEHRNAGQSQEIGSVQ